MGVNTISLIFICSIVSYTNGVPRSNFHVRSAQNIPKSLQLSLEDIQPIKPDTRQNFNVTSFKQKYSKLTKEEFRSKLAKFLSGRDLNLETTDSVVMKELLKETAQESADSRDDDQYGADNSDPVMRNNKNEEDNLFYDIEDDALRINWRK